MAAKTLLNLQHTVLTSAIVCAKGLSIVKGDRSNITVVNGGSGYKVGETLTVAGGTASPTTKVAKLRVLEVINVGLLLGVVSKVEAANGLLDSGVYPTGTKASNPVSVTGGSGTGATFTLLYDADTPPRDATFAIVQAEVQDVRYRLDGTAPTSSTGHLLKANDNVVLTGAEMLAAQFIEAAASAKLNVTFFKN